MCDKEMYEKLDRILALKVRLQSHIYTTNGKREYRKYLATFNYCVNQLDTDYKEIFVETYVKRSFKFWWVDKYCKSSFYRKRIKAIYSFVLLFEMIYENFYHFSRNIYRSF